MMVVRYQLIRSIIQDINMEFKEIKRVIYNLEYQETRETLTTEALEYLKELKIILKQREEMLEMLIDISEGNSSDFIHKLNKLTPK